MIQARPANCTRRLVRGELLERLYLFFGEKMRTKSFLINKNHPITIIKISLPPRLVLIKRELNKLRRPKKKNDNRSAQERNEDDGETRRKSLNGDKKRNHRSYLKCCYKSIEA